MSYRIGPLLGLTCAALLLCSLPSRGQASGIEPALDLFRAGEWERTVEVLESLIDRGTLAGPDLIQARKYLGICYILFDRDDRAKAAFKQIVRNDPSFYTDDLRMEDGELPDEAVRIFSQGVLEVRREEIEARQARLTQTSRLGAFLRSAALPGWGQRYQGYARRGYLMLGATAAAIAYAVVAERAYSEARDTYRGAPVDADFNRLYREFEDKGNQADLAQWLVGTAWALNMIDAGSQGPNIQGIQGFSLAPRLEGGVQLTLKTSFD
ncbi:MAG: hypothetical protein GKR89_16375 [Candidatus Latescibacteria bacterium]|nr:hypothetical protein [Candidatus Latescibacterota bacterium]